VTTPTFTADEKPAAILDRAARWLADELGGFRWLTSSRHLVRTLGDQRQAITLRSSTWSRAGTGTWVEPRVFVQDRALQRWRRAHPDVAERTDAYLLSVPVGQLRRSYTVELFGPFRGEEPGGRYISLDRLGAVLAEEVVPALDAMLDPGTAAEAFPLSWCGAPGPLAEWARSRGDDAAAQRFHERAEERRRQFPGWDRPIADVLREGLADHPGARVVQVGGTDPGSSTSQGA
jgi:hypothetical protein